MSIISLRRGGKSPMLLTRDFLLGRWVKGEEKGQFGYDFWYQPYWDVLISSEWGAPRCFVNGFKPEFVEDPSKFLHFDSRSPNSGDKHWHKKINISNNRWSAYWTSSRTYFRKYQ